MNYLYFMQPVTSDPYDILGRDDQSMRRKGWSSFLHRRIFQGFKVAELLAWIVFLFSWPMILGLVYWATGRFSDPAFMAPDRFLLIQVIAVLGKGLFLLPLWWLYFVKLKDLRFSKKIVLHFFTAALYIVVCISFFSLTFREVLDVSYTRNDKIRDIYNLFSSYLVNFAIFHAYNFWLHTKRQLRKEQALRDLAYQSEIHALKSQIEPHFLFNTLNSISASVPPSLENTRVLIAQLADTFRYALRVNEQQLVPLSDELNFIKTWLALEKHRFENRLKIEYQIDPAALQAMVPPMLLQPLVENALNHGIAEKLEGGIVTIQCLAQEHNKVYVGISDSGVGYNGDLDQIFDKGVGLSNTAKRLKLFYNETLFVKRQAQGLLFSFHLPMKPTYETKRVNY